MSNGSIETFVTETLDIIQKSLWISWHFGTENYTSRLDRVQNFSCLIFWNICPKIYAKNIQNNLVHKDLV